MDLARTIAPKSDQLNADDLIAGSMTIKVTDVRGNDSAEQPVSISFEGDDGKPYKPCKSMRRVLVHCWGPDGKTYAGRRMTLYRDDKVAFGGIQVGGIRISHLSHIDRETTMALTATRAKRAPFTVRPLSAEVRTAERPASTSPAAPGPASTLTLAQRADAYESRIQSAPTTVKLKGLQAAAGQLMADLDAADPERKVELDNIWQAKHDELFEAEAFQ